MERLNNNPEETDYINIVVDNINNNNTNDNNDADNDSIQDAEDWDHVELFDIPEDYFDPDDDDDPDDEPDGEPDGDHDGDPFKHLTELEKEIVNDFRSVCVLDNPISHNKVRIILAILKRSCIFKFPSYNTLFKPKYKVEIKENKYNPTNAPGSLIECRYVYIRFRKRSNSIIITRISVRPF